MTNAPISKMMILRTAVLLLGWLKSIFSIAGS
ncbi:hypothetical protein C8K15_11020 [Paenisporosarcina sp. OV554]|nr:hypothetical protein C8K15_11020 [Paenisporosarcina sp. OV554]